MSLPVGPPRRRLASPPLRELDQRDEVGRAERLADLREEPGRRFDVVLADRDPESLAPSIEIACDDSAEDAGRGGRDRVERGERRLLDLVAERGERGDGVLDRGDAVSVGRIATGLRRSPSDAEAAGIGTDLVRERTARRRRGVGIARHRPGSAIEDGRAIAHRAREHVLVGEHRPVLTEARAERRAGAARLQPDQAACARRHPDRSAHVVRVRRGHEPCGNRGARATTRATGRTTQVPRVVRRAVRDGLGEERRRELREVRLADEDESRRREAFAAK